LVRLARRFKSKEVMQRKQFFQEKLSFQPSKDNSCFLVGFRRFLSATNKVS
jgi:hypothetical protein